MKWIYKILLFLILLLITVYNRANAMEIDSLLSLYEKTIDKKIQVDLLNEISEKYSYISYDSLKVFSDKAYKLAIAADYTKGEIISLNQKATYALHIGETETAHSFLEQAKKRAELMGDKILLAKVYGKLGDVFFNTSLYDKAFEYYSNAADIFKNENKQINYLSCQNRLGVLYAKNENYEEALNTFNKILEETSEEKNYLTYIGVLNNIATVKSVQGDYKSALSIYQKILETNKKHKNYRYISGNMGNISSAYLSLKDTINSLAYIDSTISLSEKINDLRQLVYAKLHKSKILMEYGKLETVEQDLKNILAISKESEWPEYCMETSQYLSNYYELIGDSAKAFKSAIDYIKFKEEVDNKRNTQRLSELKFKYDFEKESLMHEEEKKHMKIMIKALFVLIAMAIAIIVILFIQRKTKMAKIILEQKNMELSTEKLHLQKENLKNQLELKNKEVTSSIILLQKKNDMLSSVAQKLLHAKKQFTKANWTIIEKCIEELKENTDDSDWKNFEFHFNQVYESFYQKLNEINPNLTANDRKLCAYIKLKMSTKEISALTNSTPRSVEVARYRLRKKLNITSSSISINSFLENL